MAEEIRRVAEQGLPRRLSPPRDLPGRVSRTITATSGIAAWAACEEVGTVMVFHFGGAPNFMPRAPFDVIPHVMPFQTAIFAAELLWSPIMRKFPNVRMALAEGGIGWMPYFLEKADFVYDHHRRWTGADFGDKLPSQVFREHVQGCFIDDVTGLAQPRPDRYRPDHLGMRLPALGLHLAPGARGADEVPGRGRRFRDEEIEKVTWQNAARWYQFDPFEHRTREQATVGSPAGQRPRRRHHAPRVRGHRPLARTRSQRRRGSWAAGKDTCRCDPAGVEAGRAQSHQVDEDGSHLCA